MEAQRFPKAQERIGSHGHFLKVLLIDRGFLPERETGQPIL
jgi:hypothetical protein